MKRFITSLFLSTIVACSSAPPVRLLPSEVDLKGKVLSVSGQHFSYGMNTPYSGILEKEDGEKVNFVGYGRNDFQYLQERKGKIVEIDCTPNSQPCYVLGLR